MEEVFLSDPFDVGEESTGERISPLLFEVWSMFWTLMGMSSFVVGREYFLTNCQSVQEMSAPLSIKT